MSYIKHVLDAW